MIPGMNAEGGPRVRYVRGNENDGHVQRNPIKEKLIKGMRQRRSPPTVAQ